MIAHVILCLNEREIEKRKRKEIINRDDQISKLIFNFSRALSILTFSENELTIFTEKSKRKTKKRRKEKKRKKKRKKEKEKEKKQKKKEKKKREKEGETRRKKRKEKLLFVSPYLKSQFLCDLLKTYFF